MRAEGKEKESEGRGTAQGDGRTGEGERGDPLRRKQRRRNTPPESGIRIPAEDMRNLVIDLFDKGGTSREDAELMADILVLNDLRCLFSHGTRQVAAYVRNMLKGTVNPRPQVKVNEESPAALVMDGDGGLGYFPCHRGTELAIAKATTCGIAALTTRNHHHFGAASNYSRQAVAHDCIGISVSASRRSPNSEQPLFRIMSSSPISVAIPSGEQPPVVLDMGGNILGFSQDAYEQNPSPFFKALGLAAIIQALGGVFAGIYREDLCPPRSRWESNQGAFIAVIDVSHFMPVEELKKEMDTFVGNARSMKPLPGLERAELAGGFEWAWAQENEAAGIPVGHKHQSELEEIAAEVGVETPFARCEDTRF